MHHMDADEAHGEEAWRQLLKNATSHTEQILEGASRICLVWLVAFLSNYTVTYFLYLKPFKSDEQDVRDTAGEVRVSS